jgi:hypothetical protein
VNKNGLALHYDTLTAWERYPLLQAAIKRGDHAEAERLASSAPTRLARVPHYYGLWEGLLLLTVIHLAQQLERVCALYSAAALGGSGQIEEGEANQRIRLLARHFVVAADAWKLFCADLHLDPDWIICHLPGFDLVRSTKEAAMKIAAETANGPAPGVEQGIESAADQARKMREFLAERAAGWM